MKYMHFRASCAYAGLANLMERFGVDTEDTRIALEMDLPWLFHKDGDGYLSGPMLQSAEWFNLWLKPRGFIMMETAVPQERLCGVLQSSDPLMLGIETPYGKHAVVWLGYDGAYRFLNPTYENSGEQTELVMTESELLQRTDGVVQLARITQAEPEPIDLVPLLCRSAEALQENAAAIARFSSVPHAPTAYLEALNPLFRPLLLDGIGMLTLIGETALAERFTHLQNALMTFLRGTREGLLSDVLKLDELQSAAEAYVRLIQNAAASGNAHV